MQFVRKALFSTMLLLGSFVPLMAQNLSGTVVDAETQEPLTGAHVVIVNTYRAAYVGPEGEFTIQNLPAGSYDLRVTYVGYDAYTEEIAVPSPSELQITLQRSTTLTEEVVVSSTRVTERSAVAYTDVDREQIQKMNLGQDIPQLLQLTPSVVSTSDAGAGVGYTSIRIRGSDPTRTNVTINGIPYNDAESQGTFFVDLPDFASSVQSIQIQRGVGTSTNGAGAFGATVNIQTNTLEREPYAQVSNSFGSYNTWKHTVRVGTGLLGGHWAFDGRLSKISSDGYIDRARSDLKSFFTSAGYYGEKTVVKLNVFSGFEETYQAWNGVPEAVAKGDAAGIEEFIGLNWPSDANAQYLRTAGRTLNYAGTDFFQQFPAYNNEVDHYQQDHAQLFLTQELSPSLNLNIAGFYTRGLGYYEQYKVGEDFAAYQLSNVVLGNDTLTETDLVRRRWLDNHFYGTVFSANYTEGRLSATVGGGWNRYDGDHYGEIIWAQYASDHNLGDRYYQGNGLKSDFNVYSKANYQFTDALSGFLDLQYRTIGYDIGGTDNDQRTLDLSTQYDFFNPKLGLNYQWNDRRSLYASFSVANREPSRTNLVDAPAGSLPTAETLYDLEAGYREQSTRASWSVNYYLMQYKDQLIQTGELNDVGSPLMVNVPRSYRTGVELVAALRPVDWLTWNLNATFSLNKIDEFRELNYVYDAYYDVVGDTTLVYTNTTMSFSPSVIGASSLQITPVEGLELAVLTKYVGDQYLDNTQNETRKLDAYLVNDLRASYSLAALGAKEINLTLLVNNVFNTMYSSNGYTYLTLFQGESGINLTNNNFVYPQAGTNFLLGLTARF
ncbi:iron complex outermembrane recepter protein [Catalinimonas alkaloidigena]|uniref:Iron complex outermembrane recepter protein n=1 Tax=Catalinimonas alkaloidigena TaxID=1075417 RepID=A0A1G9F098_9BACT|nr:TonB-dependent receptor [Catalinimonas alkaloidigena]SDK81713.1 iron complex outermembrane recepter protein [Catalinimonas alkaloidigena]